MAIESMRLQFFFDDFACAQFFFCCFHFSFPTIWHDAFFSVVRKFHRNGNDNPEKSTLSTMIKYASLQYLWSVMVAIFHELEISSHRIASEHFYLWFHILFDCLSQSLGVCSFSCLCICISVFVFEFVFVCASNKYVHGIQYLRHHIAFGINRRAQMELVPVLP